MVYSISWQGRNWLIYTEDDRTLKVEVEDGVDRPARGPVDTEPPPVWLLIVYTQSIQKWDDGEPITREERQRIAGNISEALTTTGTRHTLE